MTIYSIKDLEQLSGIKAHTLRIWEQRYNFINPKRTGTNIRYYNGDDLKLILNISLLKDNGYKISKISDMTPEQMKEAVLEISDKSIGKPEQIYSLTLSMLDMDEDRFEKIIATNILQLGFEKCMSDIIYPFFIRLGVLWQTGSINPAHEHFISNLVRQKLIVAIDNQHNPSDEEAERFMLFTPEGELHEISLLFACYMLKKRKKKVYYLGQSLPADDLESVYKIHEPHYLMTVITSQPGQSEVQDYINNLGKKFPDAKVLVTGPQVVAQGLSTPSNVHIMGKIEDLNDIIENGIPSSPDDGMQMEEIFNTDW